MMDYTKLVAALRYTAKAMSAGKIEVLRASVLIDAADAIEALQAQLPERGEWVDSKEIMRPDMCSACGCIYEADRFMDKIAWHYCPNCGAKMEVQDGQ